MQELRILMYHQFPPESTAAVRSQCEHIRRYYSPVSMAEVANAIDTGKPLNANPLAITIDDGYQDFLNGFPIFQEFGIPVTVFLVSDFLDRRRWLWWNEIEYALAHTEQKTATVELASGSYSFPIVTAAEKLRAGAEIAEALKGVPEEARERSKNEILRKLGVTLPAEVPKPFEPLTWGEVRQLAAEGVEFGAHTRTHPILSWIADEARLNDEIAGSKRRIEEEVGKPVAHFCYPNGRRQDIGARALECTRNAGFQTAVTTERGMNVPRKADPFLLRRLAVGPETTGYYFAELLAGFRSC
jgi:peptidoglycan/xylan/chitin deacetylase (PgdA/CDA1 family)